MRENTEHGPAWTFLTHHARVLARVTADAHTPLRDIAEAIGITETAVQHIEDDLCQAVYLRQVGQDGSVYYELGPCPRCVDTLSTG
ncbi:MAG TPA: hypothetical protein VFV66_08965 [Nonomuraea sp.]|nr:hypothetical protein [Nonomuraea sp.]